MEISTRCKDIKGKQIYEGSYIRTQIDGLLPNWYEGEVVYFNGCYGLYIEKGHFEPMCWFIDMEIIELIKK